MTDPNKSEETGKTSPEEKAPALLSFQPSAFPGMVDPAARTSRLLAAVALAVALVAGATALYMWKELEQARTSAALRYDELSDRLRSMEGIESRRGAELEQAREGSAEATRQYEALKAAVDEVRTRVTRDRSEWLLAETDFLLGTANRKLQLDRDVPTAIAALVQAEDRLQQLNDPSLTPVRTAVVRDLQTLRRIPAVDRTSLALQISSLIGESRDWPLAQGLAPGQDAGNGRGGRPPITGVGSFFAAVWHEIKGLVSVRRLEEPVIPMLAPEQQFFLHENLALKLAASRVALLQREPAPYQATLVEAEGWVKSYFDTSAPAVQAALGKIGALRAADIAPALPDIGESLRQLRRIKRELEAEVGGGSER